MTCCYTRSRTAHFTDRLIRILRNEAARASVLPSQKRRRGPRRSPAKARQASKSLHPGSIGKRVAGVTVKIATDIVWALGTKVHSTGELHRLVLASGKRSDGVDSRLGREHSIRVLLRRVLSPASRLDITNVALGEI